MIDLASLQASGAIDAARGHVRSLTSQRSMPAGMGCFRNYQTWYCPESSGEDSE